MNIDTEEIQRAVIAKSVESIVEMYTNPEHEIRIAIEKAAERLLKERVDKEIVTAVQQIIDKGLETLVIQPTNNYGEKNQPSQSVREYIGKCVSNAMTEHLDCNGKPTTDSWYAKPENTRINRMIKDSIGPIIQTEVNAMSEKLKSTINHYIGEFVKVQLSEATKKFGIM